MERKTTVIRGVELPEGHRFDPRTRMLSGPRGEIEVPPRVAALLALFLERPGELLDKDTIIAAAWGGAAVADDSVFEAVSVLRRVLGDDARSPRYVRTVPGRGYQFVAPIADGSRRRWRIAVPLTAAAMVLAVASLWWWWPTGDERQEPALPALADLADRVAEPAAAARIAVLPFVNRSGDDELEWLGDGMVDLLTAELASYRDLSTIEPSTIFRFVDAEPRDGSRSGTEAPGQPSHVVTGSFMRAGETTALSWRLHQGERPIASGVQELSREDDLFAAVRALGTGLRRALGLPSSRDPSRHYEGATTPSPAAYRLYAAANRLYLVGRELEAIPLFERALEIDPEFAMAAYRLGAAFGNMGQMDHRDRWLAVAVENLGRVSERERLIIELAAAGTQTDRASRERLNTLKLTAVERYPNDLAFQWRLTGLLIEEERWEEAALYRERFHRITPSFQSAWNLVHQYALAGRVGDAVRIAAGWRLANPDDAAAVVLSARAAMLDGRPEAALQELGPDRLDLYPIDHLYRWDPLVVLGRFDEAREAEEAIASGSTNDRILAWRLQVMRELYLGNPRSLEPLSARVGQAATRAAAHFQLEMADHAHLLGDPSLGLRIVGRAAPFTDSDAETAFLYHAARARLTADPGELERALQAAEQLPERLWRRARFTLLGTAARAAGRVGEAIEELEAAAALLPPGGIRWFTASEHWRVWFELGHAYLEAGRVPDAVAQFEALVNSGIRRVHAPIPYVRSLAILADLHERSGAPDKAAAYRSRYAALWADSELDGRVLPGPTTALE